MFVTFSLFKKVLQVACIICLFASKMFSASHGDDNFFLPTLVCLKNEEISSLRRSSFIVHAVALFVEKLGNFHLFSILNSHHLCGAGNLQESRI